MTIPVFPTLTGLEWPLVRSPIWKTIRQESTSGAEVRIGTYTYPRWKWSASVSILQSAVSIADFQTLVGFINSRNAGVLPFNYTDPADNSVVSQSFGTGDGTTTQFQLVRAFGGFVEPVFSLNGSPSIYVNGTLKTVTTDYILGGTGIITFSSAPAANAALTWTGSYYWLCRFDEDTHDFSAFSVNLQNTGYLYSMSKISFTSIKI
jgi:uncharacterized protein (TIGR02217 family)